MMQHIKEHDPWDQIRQCVFSIAGEIRYGKVELTIHDAQVVQVEVTEKFRQPPRRQAERQVAETIPAGQNAIRDSNPSADRTTGSTSYSSNRSTSE